MRPIAVMAIAAIASVLSWSLSALPTRSQPLGPPPSGARSTRWWCDAPPGYYPSVPRCSTRWRAYPNPGVAGPSTAAKPEPPKGNQSYKANWRRIEADNGAVYAIDMSSISHNPNGSALAAICIVDNNTCLPPNVSRLLFDCHDHYQDLENFGSPILIVPPRSVVGQVAALACADASTGSTPTKSESALDRISSPNPIAKAFTDCLLSQGQNGSYTSVDGGKSAMRLMGESCKA
jgi:hypothetical protein